jgi:hypothetical protein
MLVFLFCSVIFIIILLSDIVKEDVIVVGGGPWIAIMILAKKCRKVGSSTSRRDKLSANSKPSWYRNWKYENYMHESSQL